MTVYRVNWLRERARFKRWKEEKILLKHEMKWAIIYFQYRETEWVQQLQGIVEDTDGAEGLAAYAAKQADIWAKFAKDGSVQLTPLGDINL
jgi:hypothetical protein